jgi:hypothetical protein
MADISQVFEVDDICRFWIDIAGSIRVAEKTFIPSLSGIRIRAPATRVTLHL